MSPLLKRVDKPEWMDTRPLAETELNGALRFLRLTNVWFGGNAVVLNRLFRWSSRWHGTVTVLDVGTGLGDIPVAIITRARQKGLRVKVLGIDIVPEVIDLAKRHTANFPEIEIENKNLNDLDPNRDRFDYVTASLFLHHIPPANNVATLRQMDRLATRGLILSDLHRSIPGYVAVSVASALFGNHIVRHDGPLSVRRAFRLNELHQLTQEAGLSYLKEKTEPFFRLSLSGEKI